MRIALLLLLTGCPFYGSRRPDPPEVPQKPEPISGINSPFDDFNSADMSPYWLRHLVFSTNRGSRGANFDLYATQLSWKSGRAVASEPVPYLSAAMTDKNERGPVAITRDDWDRAYGTLWFALTSDREGGAGGLDLWATECDGNWHPHREAPCEEGTFAPLAALNTSGDDAYLTTPFAPRSVLFASNREGHMDLYAATWADKQTLVDPPASIARVDALASDGDDTAPFVFQAYDRETTEVVFVSDGRGGQGEHDIYCSRYENGTWSAPKNLGANINSARDEYRPIVIEMNSTRFLIFSSTREGGQGGYDLYIAGYPGCR